MVEFSHMETIENKAIFFVSLGRTGTHFLGKKMQEVIENSVSFHEIGVLDITSPFTWLKPIKEVGLWSASLGKLSPKHSLRLLSIKRIKGDIDDDTACEYIYKMRRRIIDRFPSKIFIEANQQFFGLVDLIPRVFTNSKIVFFIRDPREWGKSWLNWKYPLYGQKDIIKWGKDWRLNPSHFKDKEYEKKWHEMTQFEKLCWMWLRVTEFVLSRTKDVQQVMSVKYEDIFHPPHAKFKEMIEFITTFPDGTKAKWTIPDDFFSQKIAPAKKNRFSSWREWDKESAISLHTICGKMMQKFGYGKEEEWKDKIGCKDSLNE